ncbi:telomere and ribosome associated protein [Niveomyces insectorum RCEF 264]|uniref:Telomere and ribosome associated protein n=1 Tax=Niveomyces insectorum RCEF 264 TaxID=1081102 RepID=A0A167RI89_9HYPO|nr:telomere and ribosome associated protein [Niveomyces insectorum RCEF 264]
MSVASKNPYDLLGNEDGDAEVSAQVKAGTATRAGKADVKAPATSRRPGPAGNDAAYRDRNAGTEYNRSKPTDVPARGGARGGQAARVRGGRGSRYPRSQDDRHSKGLPGGGSEKHHSGDVEGEAEKKDEEAGERIAKNDEREAATEDAAAEEPAEPEEKHISYDDYIAQQAEKKLSLGEASLEVRKPNEGTNNKQWAAAKPLVKDEDDEFIAGSSTKTKRERERKVKQVLEIDQRFVEPERPRGGARGGRASAAVTVASVASVASVVSVVSVVSVANTVAVTAASAVPVAVSAASAVRGGGAPRGGAPRGGAARGPELNPKDENLFPSLGS